MNTMTLPIRRSFKHIAVAITMAVAALHSTVAIAQSNPSPYTTAYRYDDGSRLVGTISPDPDGVGPIKFAAVRNTYDSLGLLISVETGELAAWMSDQVLPANWTGFTVFRKVDYTYDIWGRKLTERVTSGGTPYALTQYSYDSVGRVQCSAQRMNPAAYASLPASACTLGTAGTDGPDRITYQTYDVLSRVTQVQKAYGTPKQINYASYVYPTGAPLQSVTDANGNYTYYTYDSLVRLQNQYFPSKTTAGQYSNTDYEQYSYDDNSNRLTLRKRDNSTINYAYDGLKRVLSETYPSGTLAPVYYSYDLRNLQLTATTGSLTGPGITSVFDGFGHQSSSATNQSGSARTLTYQYDSEGNRTRITHPDGAYFTYAYDGLNRLTTIAENGSTSIAAIVYDNQGRRQTLSRGASVTSTGYAYDPVSRLQALTQDLAGTANDETRSFTYNAANQVITRTLSNSAYVFNELPTSTTNYAVNGLNQYTQIDANSPAHDANGNMVWDGSVTYYYDVLNRMTGASGAKTVNIAYDPKGRLFQTSGGASGTTQFLYDGDALVAEYNPSGTLLHRYVHGSNVDEPLVWYEGSGVSAANRHYQHMDHQGSVMAVTYSTGTARFINTYDPYGVGAGGNASRFQYTGQIILPDLGQYYYKARIYNAKLGRFMQTDPIGYKDDLDLYTYVDNDSFNKTDPSGTDGVEVAHGVLAVASFCPSICGSAFSAMDGALSLTQGDKVSAGVSFAAAAIGVIGDAGAAKAIGMAAKEGAAALKTETAIVKEATAVERTSASQMQIAVERGQAPKSVDRVDKAHDVPGAKDHVHFKDGTSLNHDGTIHDAHKGLPSITNKIQSWLEKHGWITPN